MTLEDQLNREVRVFPLIHLWFWWHSDEHNLVQLCSVEFKPYCSRGVHVYTVQYNSIKDNNKKSDELKGAPSKQS